MANQSHKKVVVQAPAKLNLALDIVGLAENGYHLLDMLMQSISLYETVELTRSKGYSLRCPGSRVPTGEQNTATMASKVFFTELGLLAGVDLVIHKKTPSRAGMGGGSADAAAVLVGLNELYNTNLSLAQLQQLGLLVGADVPFALQGGLARVQGVGEKIEELPSLPPCFFTVAMPKNGVSTPIAYQRYDEIGSPIRPNIAEALQALQNQDLPAFASKMQNVLEHANGGDITLQIRHCLQSHGALGSMMTGSGAAVFGIFETHKKATIAAQALPSSLANIFVVQAVSHGPQIVNGDR